jgi:hypothetical protein
MTENDYLRISVKIDSVSNDELAPLVAGRSPDGSSDSPQLVAAPRATPCHPQLQELQQAVERTERLLEQQMTFVSIITGLSMATVIFLLLRAAGV